MEPDIPGVLALELGPGEARHTQGQRGLWQDSG